MSERVPEYQRLASKLREEIRAGVYKEGDRLPTLRETASRFGVAYATAAKAYETLRDAGVTNSRPGSGTVVRSRDAANDEAADVEALRSELRDLAARVQRLEAHVGQSTDLGRSEP